MAATRSTPHYGFSSMPPLNGYRPFLGPSSNLRHGSRRWRADGDRQRRTDYAFAELQRRTSQSGNCNSSAHEDALTFQDGRLTIEAGQELVPETPVVELTVQNRELLHAFRTGENCEYDLSAVLSTMEVLGRRQDFAGRRRQ